MESLLLVGAPGCLACPALLGGCDQHHSPWASGRGKPGNPTPLLKSNTCHGQEGGASPRPYWNICHQYSMLSLVLQESMSLMLSSFQVHFARQPHPFKKISSRQDIADMVHFG